MVLEWIDSRYQFDNSFMSLVTIKDKDGNKVSSIEEVVLLNNLD